MKKTESELRKILTEEEYRVTQIKGTEAPYTGKYNTEFRDGEYTCVCCGEHLFTSNNKYQSGCGWPAFDAPAKKENINEHEDETHGMIRTEVTCQSCGAHLGHVFPDGPTETTGIRYCINSASLNFQEKN